LNLTLYLMVVGGSFRAFMVSHTMYATYAMNAIRRVTQMALACLRCLFTTVFGNLTIKTHVRGRGKMGEELDPVDSRAAAST